MRAIVRSLAIFIFSGALCAAPQYPRALAQWQEAPMPPASDAVAHMEWSYAANYSRNEWRVYMKDGRPHAQLTDEKPHILPPVPGFTPKVAQFRGGGAFAPLDDGWLVGFNQGEFGAALYWFSWDNRRNYKISNHQVVEFFSRPDGIYAIEGLAHMGMSQGSVIRIARAGPDGRWQAATVTKLPYAPYAASLRADGTAIITTSASLVSVSREGKLRSLLPDAPWGMLYPNSSILSEDGRTLYIGMRQYVGEFDIETKKLRFLIPSPQFLNKLPKEQLEKMRETYGKVN